jgi:hypothetical protein
MKKRNTRDYKKKVQRFAEGGVVEHAYQRGIRRTEWHKEFKEDHGESPDLATKDYDYRKAWRSGARPDVRDDTDVSPRTGKGRLHWPSEFKGDDHPNRFVNGVDTKAKR